MVVGVASGDAMLNKAVHSERSLVRRALKAPLAYHAVDKLIKPLCS